MVIMINLHLLKDLPIVNFDISRAPIDDGNKISIILVYDIISRDDTPADMYKDRYAPCCN